MFHVIVGKKVVVLRNVTVTRDYEFRVAILSDKEIENVRGPIATLYEVVYFQAEVIHSMSVIKKIDETLKQVYDKEVIVIEREYPFLNVRPILVSRMIDIYNFNQPK